MTLFFAGYALLFFNEKAKAMLRASVRSMWRNVSCPVRPTKTNDVVHAVGPTLPAFKKHKQI